MKRIDPDAILAPLKDFQRRTVDYAFRRMYLDEDLTRRFLVADEVGLGKTMIARGLIAKVIDHLYSSTDRIDIVYICSNGNIARQNINRLNFLQDNHFVLPSRITLLPTKLKHLNRNQINFVSLTPSTSFSLRSNTGRSEERVLLYHLLEEHWRLSPELVLDIFRGSTRPENFRDQLRIFDGQGIDPTLQEQFLDALAPQSTELRKRLLRLITAHERVALGSVDNSLSNKSSELVGDLRFILARACIDALEPDLIILDEFQRFKDLLDPESETGTLARVLFDFQDKLNQARVLLLSATPYKMYTLSHEEDDDHYTDFLDTIRFLLNGDQNRLGQIQESLGQYRLGLLGGADSHQIMSAKQTLESELRRVMVRTERLAVTPDRNGMLRDAQPPAWELRAPDLQAYLTYEKLSRTIGGHNMLAYWKSAPYLLNFMQEYRFKRDVEQALANDGQEALGELLLSNESILFHRTDYEAYTRTDPDNASLRSLLAMTVGVGLWKLLWLSPTLPYYRLQEPFASVDKQMMTKRLVFSSWQVAPRVIASVLSYEAERMIHHNRQDIGVNTPETRNRIAAPLNFVKREGEPGAMSLMTLVYPSIRLAELGDPLTYCRISVRQQQSVPTLDQLLDATTTRIAEHELPALRRKYEKKQNVPPDEAWYWIAPLLMDLSWHKQQAVEWLQRPNLISEWARSPDDTSRSKVSAKHSGWESHASRFRSVVYDNERLGPMPSDLARVLAMIAVASPPIVALRSLSRVLKNEPFTKSLGIRLAAGQIAHGFISFFNSPEATTLLRDETVLPSEATVEQEPYWRRVLRYCQAGCLQAVLDEYTHLLFESLGLASIKENDAAEKLSLAIQAVLRIRTANLTVDDFQAKVHNGAISVEKSSFTMRNHFAMRFGSERSDDAQTEVRAERVRESFNSPFWPFVLATTSIGQEGLDFHPYCHSVVHWNLPANPVDLEQREGRVHRYKGHAIRKNVALAHAQDISDVEEGKDPWAAMFDAATRNSTSELSPFWIYPRSDGAQIESIVPSFPLSREQALHSELRSSLAAYRLAFGQPRQEDLVEFLQRHNFGGDQLLTNADIRINLEPPAKQGDTQP